MKKFAFASFLLGALVGGLSSQAIAAECYPCQPCYQQPSCWGTFNAGAEWLYWKTHTDSTSLTSIETTYSNTYTKSKSIQQHFDYKSGYRVNIGYELPGDQWEANIVYTYVPTQGHSGNVFIEPATHEAQQVINSNYNYNGISTATAYHAKATAHLSYVDVDIARTIFCGDNLNFSLRPHIGFRGAWMDQKYSENVTLSSSDEDSTNHGLGINKIDFNGCGIEGGLWSEWRFCSGLSIVGHVGGSILYSRFEEKSITSETDIAANGKATTPYYDFVKEIIHTGTPAVDYFVGLKYENTLCNINWNAHIGWEQHIWFNLSQLYFPTNLSYQGLTLGLDVGF